MSVYAFKDGKNDFSASGGAFYAIASNCVKTDPSTVIYGAAFDNSFSIRHIRVDNLPDLKKLCGSKYARSEMREIFPLVYDDMIKGRSIVFSGTPCQIQSVKNYLLKKKASLDRILWIDIVCHGTIRPKVWEDFLLWIQNKESAKLTDFSFRYHKTKWKSYPVMAEFDNGHILVNSFSLRRYIELFYRDLALTEGCYKCPFAKRERVSDITIGDFWGIRKVLPSFPFHEEVSQIIVNSEKGEQVIDQLKHTGSFMIQECTRSDYYIYQQALNTPVKRPAKCDEFWTDYSRCSFESILKKYADYTIIGFLRHCIQKVLGETGFITFVKETIKR